MNEWLHYFHSEIAIWPPIILLLLHIISNYKSTRNKAAHCNKACSKLWFGVKKHLIIMKYMLLHLCRRTAQVQTRVINMKGKQWDQFLNLVAFLWVLLFCNNCAAWNKLFVSKLTNAKVQECSRSLDQTRKFYMV